MSVTIDLLAAIISGPTAAYIAYMLAVKQNRKADFLPYFQEINGISSRILRKSSVKEFKETYDYANESLTKQQSVDFEVLDFKVTGFEVTGKHNKFVIDPFEFSKLLSDYLSPKLMLNNSIEQFTEIIEECREYDRICSEMDKRGLLASLEKHNRVIYNYLNLVRFSAKEIVFSTKDVLESMRSKKFSPDDYLTPGTEAHDKVIPVLLDVQTKSLFSLVQELKTQLEKIV